MHGGCAFEKCVAVERGGHSCESACHVDDDPAPADVFGIHLARDVVAELGVEARVPLQQGAVVGLELAVSGDELGGGGCRVATLEEPTRLFGGGLQA